MLLLVLILALLSIFSSVAISDQSENFCDAEKSVNPQVLETWFQKLKDPQTILDHGG